MNGARFAIHRATFTDIPAGEKMRRYRITFGKG
jgi:hypothetical protein